MKINLTDDAISIKNANTTVGYARYSKPNQTIEYIFVHPAFRRMGYGRLILDILRARTGTVLRPEPPVSPLGHLLFRGTL